NFRIYIVDSRMNLCPLGVKGEICVSGPGIGRGYLNDRKKTEAVFSYDPFREGAFKMYKTGDIGRYLPDGNIEFFGRKDHQVKIRGYRIELDEIENKLAAVEGVREAAVMDREDDANNKYLCGYISLTGKSEKNVDDIKRDLRQWLPEYMIPANLIILDALPLTPNGKVDRKALPEPGTIDLSGAEYIAPRDETEEKLAEIWREVLAIEKIGIKDNFFNLGGDSLKGIRIVNKVQEWLQEVVHVTILFLAPTIEELAVKLESYRQQAHDRVDAAKIAKMHSIIPPLPPLPAERKAKTKNPTAVFILCPPRSGSTLLRVILVGHPGLFAPQEFELLTFNTLKERKGFLTGKFSFYLEGVIRAIMEMKGCEADEAKAIVAECEDKDLTVQEFYALLQEWMGEQILVEKTPAYTLDLETIKRAEEYFENAKYIHLVRNPYACINSFENAKLDQLFKYENDFTSRELAELVWTVSHRNILEFLEDVPEERQYRLKYEELVNAPEAKVAEICKHLRLDFKEEMLQIYENPQDRMTDGIYDESKMLGDVQFFTHKSISTKSVEKWREKYKTAFLGDEAVRLAKSYGYLMEKFGPDYSDLVKQAFIPFNITAENKKIFCFPPQFAYGIFYAQLAATMNDYAWIGFNFIEGEERINEYIDIIIQQQPVGPYTLLGYSAGGLLTLKIAAVMEERGLDIA
ncbi:MAG: AMP-binding protein, partial [bacterium]|nr:AMP-binding protein [bacterium]